MHDRAGTYAGGLECKIGDEGVLAEESLVQGVAVQKRCAKLPHREESECRQWHPDTL